MDRRNFVVGSAAAAAALVARSANAQEVYPSRAITIISPFPPGGATEVVTRPLAAVMEPIVKQPVVIETKAGAAGQVGAQVAASAKPDGYTLLSHITSISGFAEVDRLFGRPVKFTNADFIPIARFVADPCVLIVNDQQPYKTLKDFIDDAKKRPNELIFSSSGLYGALHLPMALFMKSAGIQLRHLPTAGGGPGADRADGQQFAGAGLLDLGGERPAQGRQGARAGLLRRQALVRLSRRADHEGARPRHRVLSLGRPVRAERHARADHHQAARRVPASRRRRPVQAGHEQSRPGRRLYGPARVQDFWDADAKRVEDAVRTVGKVEG